MALLLLSFVAGCATSSTREGAGSDSDLSGKWSVTRPGRDPIVGQITKIGKNRYRFSNMYNLSGIYEIWKDMLVIKEPVHPNFSDLGWQIKNSSRLVVILAPPVAVVGTDYTGVTATKR